MNGDVAVILKAVNTNLEGGDPLRYAPICTKSYCSYLVKNLETARKIDTSSDLVF